MIRISVISLLLLVDGSLSDFNPENPKKGNWLGIWVTSTQLLAIALCRSLQVKKKKSVENDGI